MSKALAVGALIAFVMWVVSGPVRGFWAGFAPKKYR
jgi:hypothetical protein